MYLSISQCGTKYTQIGIIEKCQLLIPKFNTEYFFTNLKCMYVQEPHKCLSRIPLTLCLLFPRSALASNEISQRIHRITSDSC